MSNNKDYKEVKEETISDNPTRPTSKTTSLRKKNKPTLAAENSSNIQTKVAREKKVVVLSPSPAKSPQNDELLSARVKEAGQSFKDKIRSLGKKKPKL